LFFDPRESACIRGYFEDAQYRGVNAAERALKSI